MRVKPTGYHILVKVEEVEETTESGIVIATKTENKREQGGHDAGTVVAIGPTAYDGYAGCDGDTAQERAAMWGFQVGDKVQFERYNGKLLDLPGMENHRVIQDSNIIAVIGG